MPDAYCRNVYANGYKAVVQGSSVQFIGDGPVVAVVCSDTPTGQPGETLWQNAEPGTWPPNGPYTQNQAKPEPVNGQRIPPSPPPPPPGYKLIWRRANTSAGGFVCVAIYVPATSAQQSDVDCAPRTPEPPPAVPPPKGPITGKPPTPATGPCGSSMPQLPPQQLAQFGYGTRERLEVPVVGNLLSVPVYSADNNAAAPLVETPGLLIEDRERGFVVAHDAFGPGNLWLTAPQLSEGHLFGDGAVRHGKFPAQISDFGLLIHSQARATPAHGDRPSGILGFGYAKRNARRPRTGAYFEWSPADDTLNLDFTDTSASDRDGTTTGAPRLAVGGLVQATGDAKVPVTANPNTGDHADSTLWADDGADDAPRWGETWLNFVIDPVAGGNVVIGGGGINGELDDSGVAAGELVTATSTFGADNRVLVSDGVNRRAAVTNAELEDIINGVELRTQDVSEASSGNLTVRTGDASGTSMSPRTVGDLSLDVGTAGAFTTAGEITIGGTDAASVTLSRSGGAVVSSGYHQFSRAISPVNARITTGETLDSSRCIVLADTDGGGFTVTLPASPAAGTNFYVIKNTGGAANDVTVARNGNTINGAASNLTLTDGESVVLAYNATEGWRTIANVSSASGSGAPTDAQYLTLATNGTLTNERVLTPGSLIDMTDGGAGGNATLDVDLSEASADTDMLMTEALVYSDASGSAGNKSITLNEAWHRLNSSRVRVATIIPDESAFVALDGAVSATGTYTAGLTSNETRGDMSNTTSSANKGVTITSFGSPVIGAGMRAVLLVGVKAITNQRFWAAFCPSGSESTLMGADDPSGIHYFGVRFNGTAGDTQFKLLSNDGSSTGTDHGGLGTTVADATYYVIELQSTGSQVRARMKANTSTTWGSWVTGATNLPGSTTRLNAFVCKNRQTSGSTSTGVLLGKIVVAHGFELTAA